MRMTAFGNFGEAECFTIWELDGHGEPNYFCISVYPEHLEELTTDDIDRIEYEYDASVNFYSETFNTEEDCYKFLVDREYF